ncbi:MAG: hypothetical protein FWD97_08490 [Defluviitaleaceae bacterium]|nr:hypothetical protein [Defluviitaleaceae bacterium]
MKNKLLITALLLMLLFVVTGCEGNSSHPVSDSEITAIYENAREALTWFQKSTMNIDWSMDGGIEAYGNIWFPVIHETINTLADLEAHLRALFVDDIVNGLLFDDHIMYRDFDGILHGFGADRGSNILAGEETHEIIWLNDYELIYRVSVDIHVDPPWGEPLPDIDFVDVFDFYMVYENGNWVFSNFELIR